MPISVQHGESPIIVALPHTGMEMAPSTMARLADKDMFYDAPDRYLDQLTREIHDDISFVKACFHRFQTDVDYPYPERDTAQVPGMLGVVPLVDRLGRTIWNIPPSVQEATSWRTMCFAPYHAALAAQIARVRAAHGHTVVLTLRARAQQDALTEDPRPPDIRMSTFMGASAAINLTSQMAERLKAGGSLTVSLDGRRATGGVTRKYGRPKQGVHAIDLEFNDRNYLGTHDMSGIYDAELAAPLRATLVELFAFLDAWRPG